MCIARFRPLRAQPLQILAQEGATKWGAAQIQGAGAINSLAKILIITVRQELVMRTEHEVTDIKFLTI